MIKGLLLHCPECTYEYYLSKENMQHLKPYKYCPYCGVKLAEREKAEIEGQMYIKEVNND